MAHDVFISYSSKDKLTADAVCATLEGRGIRCWIAPRDNLAGMTWGNAIVDAIKGSRLMVLVFSASSNESPQVMREAERAVHHGIPILPLRIEDVTPTKDMELFLSATHWLDAMTPPIERHLKQLTDNVDVLLGRSPHSPTAAPAPPATQQLRRRMFTLLKLLILLAALLLSGVLIRTRFFPRDHIPAPPSPVTVPNLSASGALLDEFVKLKTEADAAWEHIKSIDRGNGFGLLLDQAQQQQRLAAEYDMRKAEAKASAAYQQLNQICRNIEQKQQIRLQAQASRQEAENLLRLTDSAFKGSVRPPSFEQGKQAFADADGLLADGKFEPAMIQFVKAGERFAAARSEAGPYNSMTEAQDTWLVTLAANDGELLNKFAAPEFQAATSQAAAAQAEVLAGQTEAAAVGFKQATAMLTGAVAQAKSKANAIEAQRVLAAKTPVVAVVTNPVPPVMPPPAPIVPAEDICAYLSPDSPTTDPIRGRFVETRNRFRVVADNELYDEQLGKTWVLYDPNKIMDWETAKLAAEQAGGRLPTLNELKSLLTKKRNPSEWASINTRFFPVHRRLTRFWTSEWSFLGLPNVYVDFDKRKWVSTSGSEYGAVLIIKDK